MWKCERHIPTSKVYPEIVAKCPACGFPRPDAAYRPPMFPEEEKPVVRAVPPPPPSPVPTEPAKTFAEDMSLGQAQRDLDATVMADLVAAAEKLKKSRVKAPPPPPKVEPPKVESLPPPTITWADDPEPEASEEPGPVVPEATPAPDPDPVARGLDLPTRTPVREEEPKPRETIVTPVATEKRPKDIPNAQKSKAHLCPAPKCRKVSRRNSPYCSKICSDRCLRLRKKATEKVLDGQEIKWLNRILTVLEVWGGDKG